MENYSVIEIKTPVQEKEFLDFPSVLYKNDHHWIRPLDKDIKAVFDRRKNGMYRGGDAVRWLLKDAGNRTVGRIAAFYNSDTAAKNEQPTGGCGFFECIDDQQAANLLFDAARDWLAEKGMEAMDGPVNFGDRDAWWGVLTDGFYEPVYGMNYNAPYYKELFENYGFKNYFDQYTYRKDFRPPVLNPAVLEKARRLKDTAGYRFGHVDVKNLSKHAEDFRIVYNRAWVNYTEVPEMTPEHAQALMRKLKPIIDGRIMIFAYHHDEPIGFFIMIPDLNCAVKHLNGKFGLWAKMKFFYHMKIRKKNLHVNGLIFGVVPEFQGRGVDCGMIDYFKEVMEKITYYDYLQLNWIGDFNPLMMRVAEQYVCAYRYKRHVTYRYLFDREKAFKRAPRVSVARK